MVLLVPQRRGPPGCGGLRQAWGGLLQAGEYRDEAASWNVPSLERMNRTALPDVVEPQLGFGGLHQAVACRSRRSTSRRGGIPNCRAYSRVNCDGLP